MTTPTEPTNAELIAALIAADDHTATPSPRIWRNSVIPLARQLARAARIRALTDPKTTATEEPTA
ncbi:hypothetical protein [Mycolicibacterium porcinum]|uniref:HNH endonuclease n=1 Tax=Mycolicibacterium porcinum TaxID=39693 RepID=A0ABV3V739_9MYCO